MGLDKWRKKIWESMLDSDMNVRYFEHFSRLYYRRDRNLKIFMACTSSASVAGWAAWKWTLFGFEFALVWEFSICLSAVLAIALPIIDLTTLMSICDRHAEEWKSLQHEYDKLWAKHEALDETAIESELDRLFEQQAKINADNSEARIPRNAELIKKFQSDVIRTRNI